MSLSKTEGAQGFLFFLASGRLLIWLIQTSGLLRPVWKLSPLLEELRACDLCLGFWVYLWLGKSARGSSTGWAGLTVLAAISSFLGHLLGLGWTSKFGVEVIGYD